MAAGTSCHAVPSPASWTAPLLPHSQPRRPLIQVTQIRVTPKNQGREEEAGRALQAEQWCPGRRWHHGRAAPFPRPGRLGTACGESVVSAVPNPKWLLRNGNPIKVLLVYLSSSGLFITVQMAATFARHSSVLARARRTEARAPQSLCVHLRGAGGRLLQRNRPGAGQCQHHSTPGHARTPPGWCLHWASAPGMGIGHWDGAVELGMSAGHVCVEHSHEVFAFAAGTGTGHWHWAFLIPGSVQGWVEQGLEQCGLV